MESLYRKYRPQTFADVVGQQHVVGTLERAVLEGRTSHAYLFCGPRGTGKTTMARLLAKALMCEHGPAQMPDGTCEQCRLIAAGEHPDVYELDAASRTGVDSVREEIINSVSYAPTHGRCKVYIIDEVHMLTAAAFNALLKTLEEPPSHVVFVLCTTDPQKIPATILSRVQRFDFRPIGNADIQRHLVEVCEQEGFTYEDAALELITVNARGGMRDALSALEQLSVFGSGAITLDAARDLLGAVSGMALESVVSALANRDVASLFVQVSELVNAGRDLLQFTRELAAYLRDVYVVKVVGANPVVLPSTSNANQLQAHAAAFGSADRLARDLALLGDVSCEMATAPNQRLVLEIAFTRMARPESDLTLESLAERVAELEQRLANTTVVASTPSAVQATGTVPANTQPANDSPQAEAMPAHASSQRSSQNSVQSADAEPNATQPMASNHPAMPARESEQARSMPQTQQSAPVRQAASAMQPGFVQQSKPAQQTAPAQPSRENPGSATTPLPTRQEAPAAQPAQRSYSSATSTQRPMQSQQAPTPNQPHRAPNQSASVPAQGSSNRTASTATAQPAQKVPNAVAPQRQQAMDPGALQRSWRQVVSELVARIPARGTLLSNAVATSDDGHELVVSLPKGSAFALKMLERPDIRAAVEGVVTQVFGPRVLVFKEGTATDLQISRGRQNQRRASVDRQDQVGKPVAAPSAQSATVTEPASATQPQARRAQPQARPASNPVQAQQAPAPLQQSAPTSPANADYPMPWDEPPAEEPYYEAVPYEELGGFPADDVYGYEQDYASVVLPDPSSVTASPRSSAPARAASSASMATPSASLQEPSEVAPFSSRTSPKPTSASRSSQASKPEPEPAATASSASGSHSAPIPNPAPSSEQAPSRETAPRPETKSKPTAGSSSRPDEDVLQVPTDLPPELVAILQNAFEVFGSDVSVSRDG